MREAARNDAAGYYAHCSALDKCIGDLRQTIADASIDEHTIFIFSSDHGEMLSSNGYNRKQKPWDESIRVPMLWHFPGALAGRRLDSPMASEDVMPTLLGLCDVEIPKSVEGLDYSGYMKGGANSNAHNAALIECVTPFGEWNRAMGAREWRGVRTARYTYVRDLKGPWLLYDNQVDPYQQKNLVGTPEVADLQKEMEALLDEKLREAHDEFKPADDYLEKWGYKDRVDRTGALPTKP